MFDVPDVGCDECPVSAITPLAFELVSLFSRANYAHESSGAALFGTDLSKWPVWAVDALVVIEQEKVRESNARFEAEQQNREN